MLPSPAQMQGDDSGHVQSWHLERNAVRWGRAQTHCGGDSEGQLASESAWKVSGWGREDGSVLILRPLDQRGQRSLGIHGWGYTPSTEDAITLCKARCRRLERNPRTGQKM